MNEIDVDKRIDKRRVVAQIIFLLFLLIVAKPLNYYFLGGLLFIAMGSALRIWASGYIYKRKKLTTSGPYRYIRNPLYGGSFLIAVGFCFLSGIPYTLLFLPLLYWLFYYPMIKEEERVLSAIFGDDYLKYCENTPKFFPVFLDKGKLDKGKDNNQFFSWDYVKMNREFQQSFYVLMLAVVVGIKFFYEFSSF